MNIRSIVQDSDTTAGRLFDRCVMVLIAASLVSMSLSTVPSLPSFWRTILTVAEMLIVVLFTIEYVLRIWTAEDRWRYIRSPYGLVDLLALLPFYVTLMGAGMIDLRYVRALRLLRVFRVFKVGRYNTATARLGKALRYARDEALVFLFATLVLLYIAAMGIHHFEHEAQPEKFESVFSSLWWAVVTLTTVGYGDAYPLTLWGRMFTFGILLCGMGIVAVPAGLIASGLSRAIEDERLARSAENEKGTLGLESSP